MRRDGSGSRDHALTGLAGICRTHADPWLEFWRSEAGLDGFSSFDLMAVAYLRDPAHFRCARVTAWVGDDALLPWYGGGPALLVDQAAGLPASTSAAAEALYCDVVQSRIEALFQ